MRSSRLLTLVVTVGFVLVLALPGRPQPTHAASGKLRVGATALGGEGFDAATQAGTAVSNIVAPMFDFMFTLDHKGDLVPGIVEKWEIAPDGLSWTYHIRKGVKFHNGDALTAKDVKFTLERYASKVARNGQLRTAIDRVDLVSDYVLRIYTKGRQPSLPYISSLYDPLLGPVQPKNYIEQKGIEQFAVFRPIGSGPFKFVRHLPGESVEYEANADYWGGAPAFQSLEIIAMPEEATRIAALKTGAVDVIDVDLEAGNDLQVAGYQVVTASIVSPEVFIYGTHLPTAAGLPTADIRVREALSLAINRREIGQTVLYGKAGPSLPSFISAYAKGIDVKYWTEYAGKIFRYDAERAKQLLKEAGHPNGFTIDLYTFGLSGAPWLPKVAEAIAGYWAKIGVRANINVVDYGTFRSLMSAGPGGTPAPKLLGQASTHRLVAYPDPATSLAQGFRSGDLQHLVDTAMPALDKVLDALMRETDAKKRNELAAQAIRTSTETYTSLEIGTVPGLYALGRRVALPRNVPTPTMGFGMLVHLVMQKK